MHDEPGELPVPPPELAERVGGTRGDEFLEQGQQMKQCILDALPARWDFAGKRVLDFGCGIGRVLRHFRPEAAFAEFYGCDIQEPTIAWMKANFPPSTFRVDLNTPSPPLRYPSDYFDLVYATSVFTHLTDSWKAWLLELRRVLRPSGLAVLTFHNRVAYEYMTSCSFDEASTGMLVLHADQGWDSGGPMVYHSNWWILKNWGEILDVEYISREAILNWQSVALLRKPSARGRLLRLPRILQPYPYQLANRVFRGDIAVSQPQTRRFAERHGFQVELDTRGEIEVNGWFASKNGPVVEVCFHVDDVEVSRVDGPLLPRQDVASAHPGWPEALNSGFVVRLPLRGYAPGEHMLRVVAVDAMRNRHAIHTPLIVRHHMHPVEPTRTPL